MRRCQSCRWNQSTVTLRDSKGRFWDACDTCAPDVRATIKAETEAGQLARDSRAREDLGQLTLEGVPASGIPTPAKQGGLFE